MFDNSSNSESDNNTVHNSSSDYSSEANSNESSNDSTPVLISDDGMFQVFAGEIGTESNFITPL